MLPFQWVAIFHNCRLYSYYLTLLLDIKRKKKIKIIEKQMFKKQTYHHSIDNHHHYCLSLEISEKSLCQQQQTITTRQVLQLKYKSTCCHCCWLCFVQQLFDWSRMMKKKMCLEWLIKIELMAKIFELCLLLQV